MVVLYYLCEDNAPLSVNANSKTEIYRHNLDLSGGKKPQLSHL